MWEDGDLVSLAFQDPLLLYGCRGTKQSSETGISAAYEDYVYGIQCKETEITL